jgi:hypothetical protein
VYEVAYSFVSVLRILNVTLLKNKPSISVTALSLVDLFYENIVYIPYWMNVILISLGIKRNQLYKLYILESRV